MAAPHALPLSVWPLRLTAHSFSFHRLLRLANDNICHGGAGGVFGVFNTMEKRGMEISPHKVMEIPPPDIPFLPFGEKKGNAS